MEKFQTTLESPIPPPPIWKIVAKFVIYHITQVTNSILGFVVPLVISEEEKAFYIDLEMKRNEEERDISLIVLISFWEANTPPSVGTLSNGLHGSRKGKTSQGYDIKSPFL